MKKAPFVFLFKKKVLNFDNQFPILFLKHPHKTIIFRALQFQHIFTRPTKNIGNRYSILYFHASQLTNPLFVSGCKLIGAHFISSQRYSVTDILYSRYRLKW